MPTTETTDAVANLLRCPHTGQSMARVGDAYLSPGERARFLVEEGIVRAFVPHEDHKGDVTKPMKAFYEEHPFPNYDGLEDVGSLIEKSVSRGFPEMLNRAIPFSSTVLEVGCGTGQLGNFLSITGRRVLSVDMCLSSLRLAQQFKEANGLGVTFSQMNLFRLPVAPEAFDVVICTGVLHHTSDPRGGFRNLVPLVRPGGHMVVGLYNRYGRIKTRIRRIATRILGRRFAATDPYLTQHEMGEEKRLAWIMDQYRNPHESFHTMDEVLRWFAADGIEFVRAIPSATLGEGLDLDYHHTLFREEPKGSRSDRLIVQMRQGFKDNEGGLFIMIGQRV